ncbi:hypothetical protein SAMD00019534_075690 [Acytostelium subglobosum LB1]|uniref:hypothetical protein n=1 Tax=Acytostelium subglobosum LB1 TaxID=1410327 RepID=UPI0006451BAA|nr:hypothetical protein SAMD00019534_075690 [Acytostelium subglobosum LB1]GAM24394.1 hypothetical protein SAMD00019534_075690 [Acytostelium subglobosum LB1]|eukprot:XP_012752720.1 hypothetical protein SAMD00019534_075690 [Acytostelium subglobosum LB1]
MQKVYPASIPSLGRPLHHISPIHSHQQQQQQLQQRSQPPTGYLTGLELYPQWGLPIRQPDPQQVYQFFNNNRQHVQFVQQQQQPQQQQPQQQPQQQQTGVLVIDTTISHNNNNSGSNKKLKTHNESSSSPVQDKESQLANILNPTFDNSLPNFSQFELKRPRPQQPSQQQAQAQAPQQQAQPQQQQQKSPTHTSSLPIMIIKDGSSNSRSILNSTNSVNDSFSPCSSMPSSPIDQQVGSPGNNMLASKQIMFQWMQELANLKKRESFLLENLKHYSDDSDDQTDASPSSSPSESNLRTWSSATATSSHRHRWLSTGRSLAKSIGALSVGVSLIYSSTSKPVTPKQTEDRQEVLQGVLSQDVDRNGVVSFSKLKVSEVSSKHLHQSFSLTFTLTETMPDGRSHVITQIVSSPFHVLSRSNKRKKEDDQSAIDSDPQEPSSPSHNKSSPGSYSSPSSPSSPFQSQFLPGAVVVASSNDDHATTSMVPSSGSSSSTTTDQNNYIDITELLVLPQKEAATKLGISESMLCKRFKECTRRKWPYRYLRKIDKVIKILSFQNGTEIPKEDREKLDKLMQEREECLRPVKIRITGCLEKDDDSSSPTAWFKQAVATVKASGSSNQLVPQTPQNKCAARLLNDDSSSEAAATLLSGSQSVDKMHLVVPVTSLHAAHKGDATGSLENILETLEMLKHTRQ